MNDLKKTITRGALGTVATGAMALATFAVAATPAMADDRRDRDRGGIGAEEIIAGAVVIGGIAALAGAFDGDRDRRFRGYDRRFDRGFRGGGERAINRCIRAAENQARRFGGWRFAQVTDIRDVDRTRFGVRVRGRIAVEDNFRFRDRFDRGRFTCEFDGRGRPFIDFDGVRGLR
jgi:hypothetical protein